MRALLLLVVACGSSSEPKASAPPTAPAPAPTPVGARIAVGEATVFELGPPEKAVFKLAADGTISTFDTSRAKPEGEWHGGAVLRADGAITVGGEQLTSIAASGKIDRGPDYNRTSFLVEGNTIVIKFPPSLPDIKLELADDGKVTLSGRETGMGTVYRVDAKDAAVRRTAFILFTTMISAKYD